MDNIVLSLIDVFKTFGHNDIVKGLNIDVKQGEFISLLGPSGCGKTTTLRLIAGLESPDSGKILLNSKDITNLEPNDRNVNTVFQNYALFPHLNVYDNIAYGLKIRGVDKTEIKKRVEQMLTLVKMEGFEKRLPARLSGGERQRIAIARALINKPDILLLDEPLGALDLKLRQHMQSELKRIQSHTNITFVYVTHDQGEALNLSSRIAVMNNGKFEQIGTPEEIFTNPKTLFVATFVGDRNIMKGKVSSVSNDSSKLNEMDFNGIVVPFSNEGTTVSEEISLTVSTNKMSVSRVKPDGFSLLCKIVETEYTGSHRILMAQATNGEILKVFQCNVTEMANIGAEIFVSWRLNDAVLLRETL